jgi:parallel beta-helix repeat protein
LKKYIAPLLITALLLGSSFIGISGSNNESPHNSQTSETSINEGSLSGYVTDTVMNPIVGAKVRVSFHETYEEDYTDSLGYYHVTNIPICWCLKNATASKEGYKTEWVLLSIGENTTYDFVLESLGNILYVGGSGSGNYSKIQDAIDNASDGDTVFVYDDSSPYYENVRVNKSINLIGENRETTVIDGGGSGDVVCIVANGVNISGFTIQNSGDGLSNSGVDIRSNFNTITGNTISNNNYGIFLYECSLNTIKKNNFLDNEQDAFFRIRLKNFILFERNRWRQNYWNQSRLLPKLIRGYIFIWIGSPFTPGALIPWFTFDWHPAREPYDIAGI